MKTNTISSFIIDLNQIEVCLPTTHVIVNKKKLEDLEHQVDKGRYLSLSDVLELLLVSRPWLLENVLYKPAIRSKIDIEKDPVNGFVKYPANQGERYLFLASKAKDFFEKNFYEIMVQ